MKQNNSAWFFFAMLYLVIDLGRPQDIIPIGVIRPGLLLFLVLSGFVLASGRFLSVRSRQVNLILAFVVLLAVLTPLAHNSYRAFNTVKSMVLYLPVIFSLILLIDSMKRLVFYINFSIIVMVYICLYSLTNLGQGSGGYFQDENDLCLYVVSMMPFSYYLLLQSRGRARLLYALSLAVGMMSIVTSFSRGGFVGFAAIAGAIWLSSKNKMVTLLIGGVLVAALLGVYADQKYRTEMMSITDYEESTSMERLQSWKAGWDMFLANPWGVGGNNYPVRFPEYQSEFFRRSMWGRVAHSLWFTLIPETGVVGIFIFLRLMFLNFKDLWMLKKTSARLRRFKSMKYLHAMALALLAGFLGFYAAGSFISVLYYPFFWYMTALTVIVVRLYHKEYRRLNEYFLAKQKEQESAGDGSLNGAAG